MTTISSPRFGAYGRVLHLGGGPFELVSGEFRVEFFTDTRTRQPAMAVILGDPTGERPLLARVHSSCMTSETLGACDCDCADQLATALSLIAEEGRGVLFYLLQEGRGAGILAKARDRMIVQASGERLDTFEAFARMGLPPDLRSYDEVGDICTLLGVSAPLVLLSNNPAKLEALVLAGVAVAEQRPLVSQVSGFNAHYLSAKRRSGHALAGRTDSISPHALPEPVLALAPREVPGANGLVLAARYQLPISPRGEGAEVPIWFRAEAYLDLFTVEERIAVALDEACGDEQTEVPVVRIQREALIERLPLADRPEQGRLRAGLRALAERGVGCIVLGRPTLFGGDASAATRPDRAANEILRCFANGRVVEPMIGGLRDPSWRAALERTGQPMKASWALPGSADPAPVDGVR